MQRHRYFEGLSSQAIFDIMHRMLDADRCTYFGEIRSDEYEWVMGTDVWDRITSNINDFNISLLYKEREPIYKIFDIEVTVSRDELNTITLRKKNERRNEMPFEKTYYIDYSNILFKKDIWYVPSIKKVIFNDPATIVIWGDGSKTVVKCQDGETYDPEKGLAMAISKKALGNKGNYCEVFKEWLPEEEERTVELKLDTSELSKSLEGLADKLFSNKEK